MRFAIVFLTFWGLVGQARAAWIELHNPNYDLPYCLTLGADEPTSFWVVLHPEGATNIVGARLQISGLPPACNYTVTPSTSALASEGDLFSTTGVEIIFASPQTEPGVLLYTVTLSCSYQVLVDWGYYVTLQPDGVVPVIPDFECPVVITTDTQPPSYACAQYIPISSHPAWCEIAVEPATWSNTKLLYR